MFGSVTAIVPGRDCRHGFSLPFLVWRSASFSVEFPYGGLSYGEGTPGRGAGNRSATEGVEPAFRDETNRREIEMAVVIMEEALRELEPQE